ncbi:winged helix-turn-helix domain-containing protein [Nocardiopsis sp. NPDC006198]|uniref:winged helix-turn-helix domain-containing protein n=1 Tax=Nocardiopsis sp. NPDC006198 TaxID=3154472 RepID=UPI0033B1A60F
MSTPQQPYKRVLEALREDLDTGRIRVGDKYPSVNELAAEHGVATVTARRALEKLRDEGLATSQQGVGWFVTEPPPPGPTVEEQLQQVLERLARVEQHLGLPQS